MFTEFDVVVSIILLTTLIASSARGVIKEILSLIALGGAAALTLYFYPYSLSLIQDHFTSVAVGSILAVVVLFIIALIVSSAIAALINTSFGSMREGVIDRILGMGFGFFKGFCIVSLIHFIIFFASGREDPEWLQSGETYGLTKSGASFLDNQLREYLLKAYDNIQDSQEEHNSALGDYIDEYGEPIDTTIDEQIDDIFDTPSD